MALITPPLGAIFTPRSELGSVWNRRYRLNNYYRIAVHKPLENTLLQFAFDDMNRERLMHIKHREEMAIRGLARPLYPSERLLEVCSRKEAQFLGGSGVAGIILPISEAVVLGMVDWPQAQIDELWEHHQRRLGQILF